MSRPDSPFLALFLLAGAAASVVGQQLAPPKEAVADPTVPAAATVPALPADRVLTDVLPDGSVWAATPTWKTGFDANGATFVPCLGPDVPSAPATFRLHTARSGEVPLALDDAMPSLAGERVVYARGAVREQYLLSSRGVEQQFVLDALPSRATLALDVAVATALEHAADAGGHTFTGAHGGVRYGHALAIDANGRELPLTTTWTGTALRITVPDTFLAAAALPLLVDPMIGTITTATVTNSPLALSSTDIAYHHGTGLHYVVYERAYSATDHDVYVVRFDAQMQVIDWITIDYTSENWTRPRIAMLEAHALACVVAQTGVAGAHSVKSRTVTCAATPVIGSVEIIASVAGVSFQEPDIGGDSDPVGPSRFLIAYERKDSSNASDIQFEFLDGNGVSGSPVYVPNGVYFAQRVAVSKTCGRVGGNSQAWGLLYRAPADGSTVGELRLTIVTRGGQIVNPPGPTVYWLPLAQTLNAGSEWDVSSPSDHELGRVLLCVETRIDLATGRGVIHAQGIECDGDVATPAVAIVGGLTDRRAPVVDCDGYRYTVANVNFATATDLDVRVNTVGVSGGQVALQSSVLVSAAANVDRAPSVCARAGGEANRFALAWIHEAAATFQVQAQGYHGLAPGAFVTRATGCGAMTIAATGTAAIGETFTVTLGNTTGLAGFLVGAPVAYTPPGCGACVVGADEALLLGNQLTVPVPGNPALVGVQLAIEGVQLLAGPGPCLGQFDLSNTIDVTIR